MRELVGAVQRYAWGSVEEIPRLIGSDPDQTPWAELWFGTHPAAPTLTTTGELLAELVSPLPYLVKLLAAERPLSLQTHPNDAQAADGFRRGVFGDPLAKPEILIALTRFEALCGFRPAERTARLFRDWGLRPFTLREIMTAPVDPSLFAELCDVDHPSARWALRLHRMYPNDPAAAASLLLNHVVLQPGEAIYLSAGTLHAYLHGTGVEVMGASDNVVRAGLTSKPVDLDLLFDIVSEAPLEEARASCVDGAYITPGAPFAATYAHDTISLRLADATFVVSPAAA
jgi:mannose-6-phosphate isomerase